MKEKIQNSKTLKSIIIMANLILPIIALVNATVPGATDSYFMFFNWLWIGFYSTVFSLFFLKKNSWMILLIIINIVLILFALVSSFLAGLPGLLYMVIKIVVPFMPDKWIGIDLQP